METILTDIQSFIAQNSMAESAFGRNACGDWRLIRDLRNGRELRRDTLQKVRDYMTNHE